MRGWIRRIQDIRLLSSELSAEKLTAVAGTIHCDTWVREFARLQHVRDTKSPIWHCHITPETGTLTRRQCTMLADLMERTQRYTGWPWIALTDGASVHHIVCRVRADGTLRRPEHATWRLRDVITMMHANKRQPHHTVAEPQNSIG
ncbi:hypothetical protein ONR57_08945 [Hoyosella sp. YIM 151337]|uniref:hypothetical protein n=1 Tax=Hoyosella sp. YIM 151337 TaxID=2992742 RepID=UPI002236425D|nr:hypothetical protein [Hoyosella sp. YIM 151337]MCW4353422.1 hypothetical protein [Hoyosella sp. YIM 151337]